MTIRHLLVILGDQLDPESAVFDGADPKVDAVWMAEVAAEATVVPSHRQRTALFLSAMRHHRDALRGAGWTVHYRTLDDPANAGALGAELAAFLAAHAVQRVVLVHPGEWRVREDLRRAVGQTPLEEREDRHFLVSTADYSAWWEGQKGHRMEWFYRWMRRRSGILMDGEDPVSGRWNYDEDNRAAFTASGPGPVRNPMAFTPDGVTKEVIVLVARHFPDHPGDLASFAWPVTPQQAQAALDDFIAHRLAEFGRYEDARWDAEPVLYHSRLSAALNLKLLHPRVVLAQVEAAWRAGLVPLASAEGFIRQVLGWREWVRGIYWRNMPGYLTRNAWDHHGKLPDFYWTGEVPMTCLRVAIGDTLRHGYAHHIQRLMVTGLYAFLLEVAPQAVHRWYLAMYVDAVEWVELPNTMGMALNADGDVMASKPYLASGAYHARMGNSCKSCRFDPKEALGPRACPFTTLYWDALDRHAERLRRNPRMANQVRNRDRLTPERRAAIRSQAAEIRARDGLPPE
jgi:deoxyribodipyrimidine photolyase-related protein